MSRELPPLNALRAFEAAARHLSFTKAASELHVTQAAISHQVKGLETYLGVKLFRRLTRKLLLTDAAQTLLPAVQNSFDEIATASEALAEASYHGTLDVILRPFFAARWLSHRLNRFWAQHPTIKLRLQHTSEIRDLQRAEADVAVRWGRGDWSGVEIEPLLRVKVAPVCGPALLNGPIPLRTPHDLKHHTLLHEDNYGLWERWLHGIGANDVNASKGPVIDDTNVRIQAAMDGQGLALAPLALLKDDISTRRLVTPFDYAIDDMAYYIVYTPGALEQPKVRAFRDWLHSEALSL
jgi:LysR family transcriptional regulator, glycine cleavage system transcriptional activator